MSAIWYGSIAGEIADDGPPDHDPTDPDCPCDECEVERDDAGDA